MNSSSIDIRSERIHGNRLKRMELSKEEDEFVTPGENFGSSGKKGQYRRGVFKLEV